MREDSNPSGIVEKGQTIESISYKNALGDHRHITHTRQTIHLLLHGTLLVLDLSSISAACTKSSGERCLPTNHTG